MSEADLGAKGRSKEWLSRKDAATFLEGIGCPIAPATLARMAYDNNARNGPPYTVVSHRIIRYSVSDLKKWAANRTRRVE